MPNPHQKEENKKYTWITPPKLPHSNSPGKKPDISTHLSMSKAVQFYLPSHQTKTKSKHRRVQQR